MAVVRDWKKVGMEEGGNGKLLFNGYFQFGKTKKFWS